MRGPAEWWRDELTLGDDTARGRRAATRSGRPWWLCCGESVLVRADDHRRELCAGTVSSSSDGSGDGGCENTRVVNDWRRSTLHTRTHTHNVKSFIVISSNNTYTGSNSSSGHERQRFTRRNSAALVDRVGVRRLLTDYRHTHRAKNMK